jgi:predicted metal-dependent hydrolase
MVSSLEPRSILKLTRGWRGGALDERERQQVLTLRDRVVPVLYRQNKRARRILIRLDQSTAELVVVLPTRATPAQGRRFALLNEGWIRDRLDQLPAATPFAPGATVPYLGVDHRIRFRPGVPALVWREGNEIYVSGRRENAQRRVEEWLKREARRELLRRSRQKAALIGREVFTITLRDPKTRWGSCSARGQLSFSWRLIMAPRHVLDYVVAHEVAHLREMNHGPRFWRLTAQLTGDCEGGREWLREQGPALHRFGRR